MESGLVKYLLKFCFMRNLFYHYPWSWYDIKYLIRVNTKWYFWFQEKHGFWFDIQDVTGTTLSAKAKLQVNMLVPKLDIYTDLSKINTTLIPICWMDEGIDELGPELIGVLSEAVIQPAEWRQIILYVWLGIFLTLFVLSLVALGRCILNRSKVERMREQVENMIHSQMQQDQNNCQLIQPMLG